MPAPSCGVARRSTRVSHFWLSEPGQTGTTSRTGAPWSSGIGSPFRRMATSVSSSIAFSIRIPRLSACRSGSPERCGSAPKCPVNFAVSLTPAARNRSAKRTPVHSPQETPPLPHWLPRASGAKKDRPLPPHSSCSRRVTSGNRPPSNSPTAIPKGRSTSPSIRNVHARGSGAASGTPPLLRTYILSAGVTSSLSSVSGVSATSGLSPSNTSAALPSTRSTAGPPPGDGWARAAGSTPAGRRRPNGIAAPSAAPTAASAAPPSAPRRPQASASARSGSSRYNSCNERSDLPRE